jgi:dihydroorotate dehydrogenase (NAD+) catalytic subunit
MIVRGIDFGNVLGASGVQGFFGEGYWFHKMWHPLGLDFSGMTFVAKTATLLPHQGNMPLTLDYTPKFFFPDCIKVKWRKGIMLNSVGLSNPGLGTLLKTGKWQAISQPFWLSVMSLAQTKEARLDEFKQMVEMLGRQQKEFSAPFALQINLSCPNTEHKPSELMGESTQVLEIASRLNVPLVPKYSIASAPIQAMRELNENPHCDAICVSNTLPFGWPGIDWPKVWGSRISPLSHLGGGGLSGKVLRPLVCRWISDLRKAGFTKPIHGGGGILGPADVRAFHAAGASSVFLGSIACLRPWRVAKTIRKANNLTWD